MSIHEIFSGMFLFIYSWFVSSTSALGFFFALVMKEERLFVEGKASQMKFTNPVDQDLEKVIPGNRHKIFFSVLGDSKSTSQNKSRAGALGMRV